MEYPVKNSYFWSNIFPEITKRYLFQIKKGTLFFKSICFMLNRFLIVLWNRSIFLKKDFSFTNSMFCIDFNTKVKTQVTS